MANSFANLVANLNLNIQNFSSNLRKASAQADSFAANLKGQINGGLVETAKKSKFEFKDVARIVQGIMISKAFYGGLNAIRNCTNAVWEFGQELEYAKIAYSNLFGDTALAEEFINVLEDFAATTPFSFSESEAAAKRLLAYGIEYKNVMYVMQGVLAASSMQNNPQVIESVSRALGQIHTKGRLMNEEMRQLAEAGIPAYEILAEKLGLTQEQLQNLGKQAIPASTAINALVEGMTERFGGVVQASTTTMKGIISNIKDNAVMIASGIFEPMYNGIKLVLGEFGKFLFTLRQIYASSGVGGLFEAIFPPEMHGALRQFAANIKVVVLAVARLVAALGSALKPVLGALLNMFNAFAPILAMVANALAAIIKIITSNATAMKVLTAAIAAAATMWVIFKLKGLASAAVAGAISVISKALAGLATVLNFVVAHPFWSLMLLLGGVIVGLSGGFGKLSDAIGGTFKKLTKIGGADPDSLLLPSQKERASDIDKFNQALDGTSDSMDDLADSTGKATKAAKGLLSFDEVFKLNDPDEGGGAGSLDTDFDFELPDLGEISGGGGLDPDAFNFDLFADDYVTNLINALKEKILGAGIGAILGGLLGAAFGGVKGTKLGMAIGAVAGWFWDSLAEKLGLSDSAKVTVPIATALGTLIGKLVGHPVIGTAIGALVGWLISAIWEGIETGDWSGAALPAGIGLGAAVGALVGHPVIGAAIGALVGWIGQELIDGFANGDWDPQALGTGLGTGIGAAIGFIVGGPAGAAIGSAVGALVGWIGGLIVDNWDAISQWFVDVGKAIGDWCVEAWNNIKTWVSNAWNSISTWCSNTWNAITTWVGDTASAIGNWVSDTWNSFKGWCSDTWNSFTDWCSDTWNSVKDWTVNTATSIGNWANDTWSDIKGWVVDTATSIGDWASDTWNNFKGWCSDTATSIGTWATDTWGKVKTWGKDTAKTIGSWASDTWNDVSTWAKNTGSKIGTWASDTWGTMTKWGRDTSKTISDWTSNAWSSITGWCSRVATKISTWFGDLYQTTKTGLSNIWNKITGWISDLWDDIWGSLTNIGRRIGNWWDNLWSDKKANVNVTSSGATVTAGHARGGVFNREHVARFAEGNKAEAIIPLENAGAMQPFVDAVSNGLTASLMPLVANITGSQNQLQPLYVGTLIADERGLRELERKMEIIRLQENRR